MSFDLFQKAIELQFSKMQKEQLYNVDVSKDQLWQTYLLSFPEGTNPVYRERSYHDCQCCKQFIRVVGNVVFIRKGKPQSIWDVKVDDPTYQAVADKMAELVRSAPVTVPFFHYESTAGTRQSHSQEEDGTIKTWEHFHLTLPAVVVMEKTAIATRISKLQSSKDVFQRSLTEITPDSVETVLELIEQKSLYRGEEHQETLQAFQRAQREYGSMKPLDQENYAWAMANGTHQGLLRLRNTSIGTLLVDISEGKELDSAVRSFEAMVAPANYKRPTALITKNMIVKAQETVQALGLSDALERRHATPEDITVNNVIFANRDARRAMGGDVFDELLVKQPVNPQNFSKVEEIGIEEFISKVVPKASKIELLLENNNTGNLFSLVAPVHPEAPNMLKWDNNFSWAYNGDMTDSMKEQVKAAGGDVEGILRFSIRWNDDPKEPNTCDYDAHCIEPSGNVLYFGRKINQATSGKLDVDIIVPRMGVPAIENITWTDARLMGKGRYVFMVNGFSIRDGNTGFSAEFEFNGQIHSYTYNKPVRSREHITVLAGKWDGKDFVITEELPSTISSREVWGIGTMQYHNVSMMLYSPNHWDGNKTGNKHYFFVLEGCKQPGKIRGFYNEFLTDKLREHRKVFEVLGTKTKAEESDVQLSGLGFSSTQRNHVYCRVSGNFDRTLKVIF